MRYAVMMLVLLSVVGIGAGLAAAEEASPPTPLLSLGVALVQPFDGGDAVQALHLSYRILPLESPAEVKSLGDVFQYTAANLHVDLLIHTEEDYVPTSLEHAEMTGGVSLPLLQTSGKSAGMRLGLCWIARRGLAWYVGAGLEW